MVIAAAAHQVEAAAQLEAAQMAAAVATVPPAAIAAVVAPLSFSCVRILSTLLVTSLAGKR